MDESPAKAPLPERYSLHSVSLDAAGDALLSEWDAFRGQRPGASPMLDPEWLRGYFEGQTHNLSIYSLRCSGQLCGLAPFLLRNWPVKWQIGELTLATFPVKRLRLLADLPAFPAEQATYDLLFSEFASRKSGFDALYFEEVPVDSFLWTYLHQSPLIRSAFRLYQPELPTPHPLLRVEGAFEQYMRKFTPKHRKNLLRQVRKLREGALGEMRLVRFESPEEVPAFFEPAVEISRGTYQWTLHQRGLSDTELVRKRLQFSAEHGWMRSYLLYCGERACAFLMGFQYEGRFLVAEIGFDPSLAKYSVGTVLQLLAIEDLFSYNRPAVFDLQDYGAYKEALSTESYEQGKLFLFRRGAYAHLVCSGHRVCGSTNRFLSGLLSRWNLKSRLKQRMRGWNRTAAEPAGEETNVRD